ncbi:MAG: hypothetical protein E7464_00540, partial [Ruminococcaceae bacterium]|nr:hypothetical protein [Oscillospiraceae bacterium]
MSTYKRLLSLLLAAALMLSLSTTVLAGEEITADFAAIAEAGNQKSYDTLNILTEPKFYTSVMTMRGQYAAFTNLTTGCVGIADCYGNLYWQSTDPTISAIELSPDGGVASVMTKYGWQPYTVNGKLLCPEKYASSQMLPVPEWGTGKYDYIVGPVYSYNSNGEVDNSNQKVLLVDAAGHLILEENVGRVFHGKVPYQRNGKWGLRYVAGGELLPREYDVLEFVGDYTLLAKKNGVYSLIDVKGNRLKDLSAYSEIINYTGILDRDRMKVEKNGLWGMVDGQGNEILPCIYTSLEPQNYGELGIYYTAKKMDGWHYISENGADIPMGEFISTLNISPLTDKLFSSRSWGSLPDGFTILNSTGNQLLTDYYEDLLHKNHRIVLSDQSLYSAAKPKTGVIYDEKLTKVLEFSAADTVEINEDRIVIRKGSDLMFYTLDGKHCHTLQDVTSSYTLQRIMYIRKGNSYAIADTTGKLVTDFVYSEIRTCGADGILAAKKDGYWHMINANGENVLPYPLLEVPDFSPHDGNYYSDYVSNGKTGFVEYIEAGTPAFADVEAGAWYTGSVDFCEKAGLMNGTGNGRFAPKMVMTRAMLVQVLYNLSGSETAPYGFTDVAESAWYADAVNWAAAKGIVMGTGSNRFSPDAPVTREQMVTILHRYAGHFGTMEGAEDALAGFADTAQVSDFAGDALA